MTTPKPTVAQLAPHVDHDVSQFLRLHREIRLLRFCLYPEVVRRAIVVAYAAHFRSLVEFFHDGQRPTPTEMRDVGCEPPADITFQQLTANPPPVWTNAERRRLCDADKLVGHLCQGRINREGAYPPWGTVDDLNLLRGHIDALLAAVDKELLPQSRLAVNEV